MGAFAVVIAAAGAVTVGPDALAASALTAGVRKVTLQASAVSGSSEIAFADVTVDRQRAVSRDSAREALQDAADQRLQAAVEAQAKERNAALRQLAASAERHAARIADRLAARSWTLPLAPGSYRLTAQFGATGLWSSTHTGLDFAAAAGTPIRAVAGGVVKSTQYDGAYGNRTIVTLDDGTEIWYCHQTAFSVSPGQRVSSGQVLGTVGSTGNSTGPHLHLEVRPGAGDPVDPYAALAVRGLTP